MNRIIYPALACCSLFGVVNSQAATITDWSFDSLTIGANASPNPSSGSGTASTFGLSNTFNNTNSVSNPDIESEPGASTGSASQSWRVRATGTAPNGGNGWASAAAIGSQGAQFDVSTVGFSSITLSFDFYATTKAEAKMAVEYTTDGSTWNLANNISYSGSGATIQNNSSSANTVDGNFFQITTGDGNAWFNDVSVDLTGISAADNDADFGFRIVNAATGADCTAANGGAYGTSGNWQFDNVDVAGVSAVPEPSSYALIGAGLAGLWSFRRFKKS